VPALALFPAFLFPPFPFSFFSFLPFSPFPKVGNERLWDDGASAPEQVANDVLCA
jgi:hypothetical protein